ncbi:branched-chain amino acid transport system permease protein [Afipia massiliensis]|uniref:Branched-chain amino acid transport system permease protein n=1 Tax=Afipia massiliensis TaxID=211460 RepID=A0A840MYH8_9BRAD|nr:branched-chain amino acid ABC transporter permease [Afipia massiliensis]MBB5050778.1 branched-chain amino acid transport system permease protein [Afipia massiliensis]
MRQISLIDVAGGIAVVAVLALAPMLVASNYLTGVLTVCVIYGIWASSWDFMSGLTGRENFGHSLFIGAGAYTSGFMATIWFTNPWYSLPAAVVIAVIFSLIVGFPTLRLRGPYFALAMLSASAILQRLCLIFWEQTGGEEGLYGLDPLIRNPLHYYWFVLAVLVVTVIVLVLLAQSHWGLLLRAIRGDEATCQAAGINVTFYKIASLAISAAFAGLGGALYAHYQLQVSPPLFSVVVSITIIIMVYVGGIGSIYGAAIAAILLTLLTEMLRGFGEYRLWIYTLTLMLILFFLPNGLIAPLWRRMTERFR